MAEGDEVAGMFGGEDAREAGGGEDVSFSDGAGFDEFKRGFLKANFSPGDGFTGHDRFGGNIHHAGFTPVIEMAQHFWF